MEIHQIRHTHTKKTTSMLHFGALKDMRWLKVSEHKVFISNHGPSIISTSPVDSYHVVIFQQQFTHSAATN